MFYTNCLYVICDLIYSFNKLLCVSTSGPVALGVPAVAAHSQSVATNASLFQVLTERVAADPFNLIATAIFLLAIIHTFLAPRFRHMAHVVEAKHAALQRLKPESDLEDEDSAGEVSFKGQMLHFMGEIEAIFGIWAVVLMVALGGMKGWHSPVEYIGQKVNFTEPMFVVIIMALASTRPVLSFAERCLGVFASIGKGSVGAWWLSLLIAAPLLGSLITEPAAMTIAALLLARQFYLFKPSTKLAYATIGLLFVNVSVGGTLTHFAAPPVLMVAGTWKWDLMFMFSHFGWRAVVGICFSTMLYYFVFRKELSALELVRKTEADSADRVKSKHRPIPPVITAIQLGFMLWTVIMAHYPALFIAGFLFFLAFSQATRHHQGRLDLRPSLLVGFFLAGLVVHGGLQGWWIEPLLSRLGEWPLFIGATVLTAFNDNAAITYLASLVPQFGDTLKFAVVAGAVTGGGLTVIANAPNPAGQSILQKFFPDGVSPLGLFLGALVPTLIMGVCFMVL